MKKGNTWHFGYKAHVGVDKDTGLVHTVEVTAANIHDVVMTSKLLTGDEESVYGDSGYLGAEKGPEALKKNKSGKKIRCKKTRYRGVRKQTAKLNMLFALANPILADRPCLAA